MDWNLAITEALENNKHALSSLRTLLGSWSTLPPSNNQISQRGSAKTATCVPGQLVDQFPEPIPSTIDTELATTNLEILSKQLDPATLAIYNRMLVASLPSPTPAVSSARERVLSLPELLEPILLELPIQELVRSQRVCILWRQMLQTSPKLQKAAFLRAKPDLPHRYPNMTSDHHEYFSRTPAKTKRPGAAFKFIADEPSPPAPRSHPRPTSLNPILLPFTTGCMSLLPLCEDFPLNHTETNTSLHNMYCIQPPVPELPIYWRRKGEEEIRTLSVKQQGEGMGVRVKELVEVLRGLKEGEEARTGAEGISWVRFSVDLSRGALVEGWRC
ncbi:hypothetical protein MBLNU230_g7012t1 [Neophaeotheca triangularis]